MNKSLNKNKKHEIISTISRNFVIKKNIKKKNYMHLH